MSGPSTYLQFVPARVLSSILQLPMVSTRQRRHLGSFGQYFTERKALAKPTSTENRLIYVRCAQQSTRLCYPAFCCEMSPSNNIVCKITKTNYMDCSSNYFTRNLSVTVSQRHLSEEIVYDSLRWFYDTSPNPISQNDCSQKDYSQNDSSQSDNSLKTHVTDVSTHRNTLHRVPFSPTDRFTEL